jgi:hypothetical protein
MDDRGRPGDRWRVQLHLVSCLGNKLFTFGGVLGDRPALPLLAIVLPWLVAAP